MTLPSDWYGVAGLFIFQFFLFMQSRRNAATAREAVVGAREVGTEVNEIKGSVQHVKAQVTNGGTNLAETVGDVKKMLSIITNNQRIIHDEHLGAINRNIAVLNEGVLEVRNSVQEVCDKVAALEEKFEGREGREHPPGEG